MSELNAFQHCSLVRRIGLAFGVVMLAIGACVPAPAPASESAGVNEAPTAVISTIEPLTVIRQAPVLVSSDVLVPNQLDAAVVNARVVDYLQQPLVQENTVLLNDALVMSLTELEVSPDQARLNFDLTTPLLTEDTNNNLQIVAAVTPLTAANPEEYFGAERLTTFVEQGDMLTLGSLVVEADLGDALAAGNYTIDWVAQQNVISLNNLATGEVLYGTDECEAQSTFQAQPTFVLSQGSVTFDVNFDSVHCTITVGW